MRERIDQELALLRQTFGTVEHQQEGEWVFIEAYSLPNQPRWNKSVTPVCFQIKPGYPGTPPYGFFVPQDLLCAGNPPEQRKAPAQPPFAGEWRFISWAHNSGWRATADLVSGSNLTNFARTFADRFTEGA